ncbi:MAG: NADH-quinone oxidoreductase subunit I, partial [Nitrososphaerales archaeon]
MVGALKILRAVQSGLRHLLYSRVTRRYPEVDSGLPEGYYSFDPKRGVATAGWKGRHYLELDKCTGCQLCSFMCDEISNAIIMVEVPEVKFEQNKKSLFPSVD